MPKKKGKKMDKPTDRANLSQGMDERVKVDQDPNGQLGRKTK